MKTALVLVLMLCGTALDAEAAVVTFHLEDRPGMLNRRTIVFQRFKSGWKIVHPRFRTPTVIG